MKRNLLIIITVMTALSGSTKVLAQEVAPGVITITAAGVSLSVDTVAGGRVLSFMLDGVEQLSGASVHPKFYGSSLWLSPENKWKGNGPLDGGAYKVQARGKTRITLESGRDTVRGFQMRKEFILHPQDSSVSINYLIRNLAADTQHVAPWEVTRVPTGGLAFFPSGDSALLAKSNLPVSGSGGITWYPYDSSTEKSEKLFSRGAEGWTAYVRNGYLFIKTYPAFGKGPWPAGKQGAGEDKAGQGKSREQRGSEKPAPAPGEENVEIYVNKPKTYMELENQGPYRTLAAGTGFLQYNTRWYVRRLPEGTDVRVGSEALVRMVRKIIGLQ